jgi:hypothetical protein
MATRRAGGIVSLSLENIETLTLRGNFMNNPPVCLAMLQAASLSDSTVTRLSKFQYLEQVILKGYPGWRSGSSNHAITTGALALFTLPAINAIQTRIDQPAVVSALKTASQDELQVDFPTLLLWHGKIPQASMLTALDISHLREDLLCHLLTSAPALQDLTWNFHYKNLESQYFRFLDCAALPKALTQVQDTVQKLKITVEFNIDPRISTQWLDFGTSGTLYFKSFQEIKTLEVPLILLLGWDSISAQDLVQVLPNSIVHFALRDAGSTAQDGHFSGLGRTGNC